jgi:hypothetical protein
MQTRQRAIAGYGAALVFVTVATLLSGCSTVAQRNLLLIREDDLQTCMSAATNAFLSQYSTFQLDHGRPVIFQIDNLQQPTITVWLPFREEFLPTRESLPSSSYLYFKLQGNGVLRKETTLPFLSSQQPHSFKLIETGGKSWPIGPPVTTH